MKTKLFAAGLVLALVTVLFYNSNTNTLDHVIKSVRYAGDHIELTYDPLDGEVIVGSVDENLHRITGARDVAGQEIPPKLYKDIGSTGVRVKWIPVPGSDPLRKAAVEKESLLSGSQIYPNDGVLGKDFPF